MRDLLHVGKNDMDYVEWYCSLLNYSSLAFGTPISSKIINEIEILKTLENLYSCILNRVTKEIGGDDKKVSPTQRKYNMMEFQRDFLEVPPYLITNKDGKVSADSESRRRVDVNNPNFLNSLFMTWGDIYSSLKIKDILSGTVSKTDEIDSFYGQNIIKIKPTYSVLEDSTYRIVTSNPNLQGLSTKYKKQYIVAEEGRLLVGADISSQEPMIFFNGLCKDEDILRGYDICGEIYRPVVSKIEGIPMEDVDESLRRSYKTGILSKMNNGGVQLLSEKMGSIEMAQKLNLFIDSNEQYQAFMGEVKYQMKRPKPSMGGFVGDRQRILDKEKIHTMQLKNRLLNAPLQITGVSLISISVKNFVDVMFNELGDWNSIEDFLEDIRPIYHAHDEVVWSIKNKKNYVQHAAECLSWALGIQFEDWRPLRAESYISKIYLH